MQKNISNEMANNAMKMEYSRVVDGASLKFSCPLSKRIVIETITDETRVINNDLLSGMYMNEKYFMHCP